MQESKSFSVRRVSYWPQDASDSVYGRYQGREVQLLGPRPSNTEFERLALDSRINLSDGHARQNPSEGQVAIFARTAKLLDEAKGRRQADIEREFIELFLACAGQPRSVDRSCQYLNYSASSALALAAQLCRMRGQRALLIEPCFDNIRHLLISHGVVVEALPESALCDPVRLRDVLGPKTALWIVQPNNPTGFCLEAGTFMGLAETIAASRATLVVDFTFRFFAASLYQWKQYDCFDAIGLDYLAIEDTGKTWPAADLKVGITICSRSCAGMVHHLHDQLLLNISPFILLILRDFLRYSKLSGVSQSVRAVVDENRAVVRKLVASGLVSSAGVSSTNVPLELLALPETVSAMDLWASLRPRGVDILPASNYYWSAVSQGRCQFRVPLSRPRSEIDQAVPIIAAAIGNLLL